MKWEMPRINDEGKPTDYKCTVTLEDGEQIETCIFQIIESAFMKARPTGYGFLCRRETDGDDFSPREAWIVQDHYIIKGLRERKKVFVDFLAGRNVKLKMDLLENGKVEIDMGVWNARFEGIFFNERPQYAIESLEKVLAERPRREPPQEPPAEVSAPSDSPKEEPEGALKRILRKIGSILGVIGECIVLVPIIIVAVIFFDIPFFWKFTVKEKWLRSKSKIEPAE